jgi:hypothetical protein
MSSNSSHNRSQPSRTAYSEAAPFTAARTLPEGRASSYSSLNQALVPPAQSRDRRHKPQVRTANSPDAAMPSDSRYVYQGHQEVAPQYSYPPYAPYDAAQYPPSSSRPARSNAPQPHSPTSQPPPPAPYAPPPPAGYPQQPYPPPAYGVPPQSAGSWPPEGWPPYAQPFVHSNASAQEPPPFTRPEAQAAGEGGAPPGSGPSNPENRRVEERPERPTELAPHSRGRKGKGTEIAALPPVSPVQPSLDYHKVSLFRDAMREFPKIISDMLTRCAVIGLLPTHY